MGIPSRASCPITRNSSSTIIGASPSVGSSISSSRGAPASMRAIASICCSPPRKRGPHLAPPFGQPRKAQVDLVERRARRGPAACRTLHLTEAQVLIDSEAGKDASVLRHQPDPAPADPVRGHATQALALEQHLAPRRRYPPGDGLDHRGLSFPVAPEKPDDFALADA